MAIPSGYSSLGLIGFTDKGDYNADTNYVQNDLCHNGGKIWKCKLDNTSGQTPAEGTYWTVFVDPTSSVSEMEDVTLTSLADGQELTYDATANKWKNTSEISNLKNALSNEVVTRATLGAHNFLRNEIQSQVIAPITFTRNDDESVHISGTMTTSDSAVGVYVSNDTFLEAGTYEISGIPESIQGGYGYIQVYVTTTGGTIGWEDRGGNKGHEIHTFAEDTHVKVILSIYNLNNQTFDFDYKPMIKLVSDPSKEYQPYAMTNRELTDEVTTASGAFTVPSTYATSAQVIFNRQGRIATVTWSGSAPIFPAQATDYEIGSIPTGFTPKSNLMLFATDMNSFTKGMYLQLKTDGTVHICGYGTGTNGSINGFPSGAYLTN